MLNSLLSLPLAELEYLNGTNTIIRLFMFVITTVLLFVVGSAGHSNGRAKSWVKYFSLLPAIASVFYFFPYLQESMNSFNRAAGQISDNSAMLWKVAFGVSLLLTIVVIIGCSIATKRINEYRKEI